MRLAADAFDDANVIDALCRMGAGLREDDDLLDACGEWLGEIWARQPLLDKSRLMALAPTARDMALAVLCARRPEWRDQLA